MINEFEITIYDSWPWPLSKFLKENDLQKIMKLAFGNSLISISEINYEQFATTNVKYKYKLELESERDIEQSEVEKEMCEIHKLFEGSIAEKVRR